MQLIETLEQFCYKPLALPAGQALILEGQECKDVFVLISGQVKVTTGDVELGHYDAAGETFGEMAVLLGEPASATVEAEVDSTVYRINDLESFLTRNPQHCFEMLQQVCRRLKQMNRGVNILWGMCQ